VFILITIPPLGRRGKEELPLKPIGLTAGFHMEVQVAPTLLQEFTLTTAKI